MPKKNEKLELEIIDLTHEGLGVAKVERYPLFIENALPGEKVEALVMKVGKKYGFAKVLNWLERSSDRNEAIQGELLRTGIADLGHLKYEKQLAFKRKQIQDLLKKNSHLTEVKVAEVIGMPNPIGYRNKAQIPVRRVNGQLETGFYRKHSHDLVPIEDFLIQDPIIDQIVLKCRDLFRKYGLNAYDEAEKTGLIKNVIVRRGFYSHEVMVVIVTTKPKIFRIEQLIEELVVAFPEIKSILQNIHPDNSNNILSDNFKLLFGQEYITDKLLGNQYYISAPSFYQINTEMAEVLYQEAFKLADLSKDDIVIDAYCGIGTIGLSIAKQVHSVFGVEAVAEAIDDAKINAKLNGIENVSYRVGRAEKIMSEWTSEGVKPSVIIVDPPRKGLAEEFIQSACEAKPDKIVYISCNPATFTRDIARFTEKGFYLQEVTPVDLFPQTHHVETVALMTRKK
ncbi:MULTISPECIES: 23S rRNA (uracil(1939)-C(5))-methyltransferase RlmD [unclassified Enterococcus]|uniref:23S rRNA (uracil(1939)-C(5))-methyltransferase RlmD n=1 Tax=unclassified Enterococcus TaxID=2608891 RepID=UPI0032DEE067